MIEVQEAVRIAVEYCGRLFGVVERLRLEEVELSDDERHWFITVGFESPRQTQTDELKDALSGWAPLPNERQYKVVNVDAETGKVRAVKFASPLSEYLDTLVARYRNRGLLVDSNLLILYLVGEFDERQIPRFRRTKIFTARDYRVVKAFLAAFPVRITTPNILTEISNLSRDIPDDMRVRFFQSLRQNFEQMSEEHVPSKLGASSPIFTKLGLTDAIIGKSRDTSILY